LPFAVAGVARLDVLLRRPFAVAPPARLPVLRLLVPEPARFLAPLDPPEPFRAPLARLVAVFEVREDPAAARVALVPPRAAAELLRLRVELPPVAFVPRELLVVEVLVELLARFALVSGLSPAISNPSVREHLSRSDLPNYLRNDAM
jgi:hypothetical protein